MTGDERCLELEVSEHLFSLATESLRLRSNETRRLQTLESFLEDRAGMPSVLEGCEPQTIRDHLTAVPTRGDIRIDLTIAKSSADDLNEVKRILSEGLGSEISLGDTLSIMLFQYVADQKLMQVLQRSGMAEELRASTAGPEPGDNVVSLR